MLVFRGFLVVLFLAVCCHAGVPGEDWMPITEQDLKFKEVPSDPGASAVQLYYAHYIDDTKKTDFVYRRYKVLNEAGRDRGNVELTIYPGTEIHDIHARTIHPDGSIIDLPVNPFEKVLVKGRGVKILAQTFTLPEVTVGSILEYKFTVHKKYWTRPWWLLEHELYTVREHFLFRYNPKEPVTFVVARSKAQPRQTSGLVELELTDVPRFEVEEQMPPVDNYKATVKFTYGMQLMQSAWGIVAQSWAYHFNEVIGDHKEIGAAAAEAIGSASDPEEKLRRLYARAQQIRNLSYERDRTRNEEKKEQLKAGKTVVDVLKHGYGTRDDVNLLFIALARRAGFSASVVMVAARSDTFFQEDSLTPGHYDSTAVAVLVNGHDVFLDPGTRFCPYGMVRWTRTSTPGVKLSTYGGTFFQMPPAQADQASLSRTARVELRPDGILKGEVTVRYEGGEALEHRLDALQTDDAGRKKTMEDEIKQWLPDSAVVSMTNSQGWENQDGALIANFQVEIPSYAVEAGKRLLVPANLFIERRKNLFQRPERKYPVYYPYPFSETDTVVLKLPAGVTLETFPDAQSARPAFGQYTNSGKVADQQIINSRSFTVKQFLFQPAAYPGLREFFTKVHAGDEGQVVLRTGATTAQSNGAEGASVEMKKPDL
jgi:hypothetical protein